MFCLYLQSSSASRQPKISNLMFFANPVYRVRNHPNAWHLETFQWHGWTQSSKNSIFLSAIYQFFCWNTFFLHLQSSSASRKWKFQRCPFSWPCTQSEKRSKRDTKKIFTGHGLRIAVWYFSIFLFKKPISIGNILSSFRILKRF